LIDEVLFLYNTHFLIERFKKEKKNAWANVEMKDSFCFPPCKRKPKGETHENFNR